MTGRKKWVMALIAIYISMVTLVQGNVWAEEAKVYLQTTSTELSVGTTQDVALIVENANQAEIVSFDGLDAFDVVSKSQSSSTSIINGSRTTQRSVNYTLMPKKEGTYDLSATVKVDGKTYKTNVLTVTVAAQSNPTTGATDDVFVDAKVSRETTYSGEKIVLTYDVYSMYNVSGFDATEPISVDHMLMEDVSKDTPSPQYLTLNNNKYVKYQAKQYVLTPTGTGDVEIPSFNFQINLSTSGFFNETKPVYAATKPITLHVKPLPTEGQPANFTGLVGQFTLDAAYDKDTVEYGDPVTLDMTIAGEGNLDSLGDVINEDTVPGFSVYETEKDPIVNYTESGYTISKGYETILVPQSGGTLDIPAVTIPYFNTETEAYDVLTIGEQHIQVTGGPASGSTSSSGQETTPAIGGDGSGTVNASEGQLAAPVVITQITYPGQRTWSMWIPAGIIILLILLGGGYSLYRKHRKSMEELPSTVKDMKKQLAKEKDSQKRYNLFVRYMESIYDIHLQSESMEVIREKINNEKQADALLKLVQYMEHERYYKERQDAEVLQWMYEGI